MSSQSIHVEIPVLPHVKDLLLSIYGPEPIKANENNLPGKELQFIFMNNKNTQPEKINGEKIKVHVSHRLAPYYYKFTNAFLLGCYFEKQFQISLYNYVEAKRDSGIPTMQAIKSFFIRYKINEEYYTQQAALECYRRLKNHKNCNKLGIAFVTV